MMIGRMHEFASILEYDLVTEYNAVGCANTEGMSASKSSVERVGDFGTRCYTAPPHHEMGVCFVSCDLPVVMCID